MNIKQELNHKLYMQREENKRHLAYETEFGFYKAIASGNKSNVETARKRFLESVKAENAKEENGLLSKNPVQNSKYHFAIMTAMITRHCVEAGLNREIAYNLSDIYIQKADTLTSIEAIEALKSDMINEYTDQMKNLKKQGVYSRHIVRCIDYINDNLNTKLTVNSIADKLGMNPTYLSKLFSKETGKSLSQYIKLQRLVAAGNMLKYTDYSITDISEYFGFSSQSHFTNAFQNEYGLTPKKYRDKYSEKNFS